MNRTDASTVSLPVLKSPPSEDERAAIARDLQQRIRGEVRFERHDRMLYATDASLYQTEPLGVVIPESTDDAIRAVEFCAKRGLPILPRGGGTSLAGQAVNLAVVIDFSANCRGVRDLDPEAGTVWLEPGVVRDELNDSMADQGHRLFFAPDTATSRYCNVGGMIGNNSSGAHSILYGRTVEHVLALDVLLLDGEGGVERVLLERGAARINDQVRAVTERVVDIVRRHATRIRERFPVTLRRVCGYALDSILDQVEAGDPLDTVDLTRLICGSEGTLAVVLGARVKLERTPIRKGLAVVGFPSVREAVEAVNPILETGPSAVELLDDLVIDLAARNPEQRRNLDLIPGASGQTRAALYVEHYAFETPDEIERKFDELTGRIRSRAVNILTTDAEMSRAWALRKAAEPLLHALPGKRKPITFVEDMAVPPERLPEFVERFRAVVEGHGTRAAFYAHASVGVLHIRPLIDLHDEADERTFRVIAVEAADLVREFGGALSAEHGDGRVRGPLLERFFGADLMNAFREVKAAFDPQNLLNPGNIVEPGPEESITEETRLKQSGRPIRVPEVDTYYDYGDQDGYEGAVEMCVGAGVCRKKAVGTMCPSYMALLDERHATRGRGNALRLAITGQLNAGDRPLWNDPETLETLDLCLSCKACKAECPTNVDIARLKSEYVAQGYRSGARKPLSSHALARVRMLNRLGALAPGLANFGANLAPLRAVANRALGLAPQRTLPRFGRALTRRVSPPRENDQRPAVSLFVDCFTGFGESDVGAAAVRTLEALGYRVRLITAGCCERPATSLGLLSRVVRKAPKMYRALGKQSPRGEPLLFLEPSCMSAFTDDLCRLKLSTEYEQRRAVADRCMLVEDFIDQRWEEHPAPPAPRPLDDDRRVILHGHCHQKALWGAETSARLLRRLAGESLTVPDSGCCGMAGAFGFARHRYDLSMRIGELRLMPAVRAAGVDDIIAAPGTSCRHQIHDAAGVRALHPVQVAEQLLTKEMETT